MRSRAQLLQSLLDNRIARIQLEGDAQPSELDDLVSASLALIEMSTEFDRLNASVNTPQSDDFLRAVSTEAEHQRPRQNRTSRHHQRRRLRELASCDAWSNGHAVRHRRTA